MAANRPRPTLADYAAIAFSPALIILLIVSLIFFLLEIFYSGVYELRLQWILFFFIFGIVLVARISMETDIADRAPLYGIALALAVWLGLSQFVTYQEGMAALSGLINAVLIALVWWSAYRLTWDCTYIDEKVEATGTGLLQAAGLEQNETAEPPPEPENKKKEPESWWERYQRYREQRKKRHTPGVWVVYYSLVALPIFGLGQSLIPVEDVVRRRYAFWLMALYAGCALGLLVTTAFLGLRRYLRQRNLEMPKTVTAIWLASGAALIVFFLVLAALLPRPGAEYSLMQLPKALSKPREAWRYAQQGNDSGRGEGRQVGKQERDPKGNPVQGSQKDKQADGGKGTAKGQGEKNKDGEKSNSQSPERKNDQNDTARGQQGSQKSDKSDTARGKQESQKNDKSDTARGKQESQKKSEEGKKQGQKEASQSGSQPPNKSPSFTPPAFLGSLAKVLRWIVFALIAGAIIFFLLRGGLALPEQFPDLAASFARMARAFWEGLFGRRQHPGGAEEEGEEEEEISTPPRPFRSFVNPFRDGTAQGQPPEELARYSFEALEAWAWEHELARWAEETPLEFAQRVGGEVPALENEALRLAALYARVLYAQGPLPGNARALLAQFWQKMEAVAEQPLSA